MHTTYGGPGGSEWGEKRERKEEKTVSVVLLLLNSPKQIQRGLKKKRGKGLAGGVVYLVASLSLSDKNEGI